MTPKNEAAREFLQSRRARITPDMVSLPTTHDNRRVSGLRREEVALLAGVSMDYYTRMEKGNLTGVSPEVLHAVARALQLDADELRYLEDLANAANADRGAAPRRRRKRAKTNVSDNVLYLLASSRAAAMIVHDRRLDVVASNDLGTALFAPVLQSRSAHGKDAAPNLARFVFFDPKASTFYPDWDAAADTAITLLRGQAARDPYDLSVSNLIGELSTRSDAFRTLWADQAVAMHRGGLKVIRHPDIGDLHLGYEQLEVVSSPDLVISAYVAPSPATAEQLALLASIHATTTAARAEASPAEETRAAFGEAPQCAGPRELATYVDIPDIQSSVASTRPRQHWRPPTG